MAGWMDSMDGWMVEQVGTVAVSGASLDLSPCVLACLPWLPLQAQGSASTRAMAKQSERKRSNREAETQRQLKRRRAAAEAGHKRERKAETERRSAQGPRTGRQEESKRRPSAGVQF